LLWFLSIGASPMAKGWRSLGSWRAIEALHERRTPWICDSSRCLTALHDNGWELIDPHSVAGGPDDYRRFIQGSKAEFGIAKSGYVVSRSGWFSDRSARYLASGRPVIAQDTGFGRRLPTGQGLFAFTDADDVVHAIDELKGDYSRHRSAARQIAEEFFDSDRVLRALLDQVI
jgi:hypothetical protein